MTHPPLRRRLAAAALALAALSLAVAGPARAAPDEPAEAPLPDGVVAKVGELTLTYDGLCQAAVQHMLPRLRSERSGPRAILEEIIEEMMVEQECERLGIAVTSADVDKKWEDLNAQIRRTSGGEQTLVDVIREQGSSTEEARARLLHVLRKERVAEHPSHLGKTLPSDDGLRLRQVTFVIDTLLRRSQIEYGVPIVEHVERDPPRPPAVLAPGVVATVNGAPITTAHYGQQLVLRLPSDDVREILDQECKTALMVAEGVRLTDAELEQELAHLRELWPLERDFQQHVAWQTVTFSDRFQAEFKIREEDVFKHRYYRGLLGLVRRMRVEVTDADVAREFEDGRDTRYGAYLIVTDVKITFAQERSSFVATKVRSKREALELARQVAQSLARGIPFSKIASDINNLRDPTYTATQVRLYNTDRDRLLYDYAAGMKDGDISSPVETLSEVHVLRREESRPARNPAEIRPILVERIARQKARSWLEEHLHAPGAVRVRWPLAQRSVPPR